MTLNDILSAKGFEVYTTTGDRLLVDVAKALTEHNIGALLVCQSDRGPREDVLGIITERDLLHACAEGGDALGRVRVREVMTTHLYTGSPEDSVEDTMGLMTDHRIRHLPVLAQGRLIGMVSIGDIVKAQHDRLAMEVRFMKDYIQG